ncbi:MAG: hypothetical protein K9K32_05865 [Halanaerobiales bacterium]|nr:hypothetical protein [Halanaerobiales bacterium]
MKTTTEGKIKWKLHTSLSGEKEHSLLYRSEYKGQGIQMEIHTSKHKTTGKFLNEKKYYFIDDDERQFEDKEEFIKALKEAVD